MIICRTPFRVSFFGGGSDYPAWFKVHGGRVLGVAIDKYCFVSMRELPPFFGHKHRIVYSKVELVSRIEDIQHPGVRAILQDKYSDDRQGLEIHHYTDLPARSGLGTSSALSVSLLHAMATLQGRASAKCELASEAIRIEQTVLQENVGSQDQVWAAYGGLNRIEFHPSGSFDVRPVVLTPARRRALLDHLVLCFTGITRTAHLVAEEKIAGLLGNAPRLHRMMNQVDEAEAILNDNSAPLTLIGGLLHEAWLLKRQLSSNVSTPETERIYDSARAAGAIGGKLLGAGAGGFMLLFVEPEKQAGLQQALQGLICLKVQADMEGSRVIFYEPSDRSTELQFR